VERKQKIQPGRRVEIGLEWHANEEDRTGVSGVGWGRLDVKEKDAQRVWSTGVGGGVPSGVSADRSEGARNKEKGEGKQERSGR